MSTVSPKSAKRLPGTRVRISNPPERTRARIVPASRHRSIPPWALSTWSSSAEPVPVTLLGGEQPPPVRLPAVVQLELDAFGNLAGNPGQRDRCAGALDHGHDLRAARERPDRGRQRRARPAPGDYLVADE